MYSSILKIRKGWFGTPTKVVLDIHSSNYFFSKKTLAVVFDRQWVEAEKNARSYNVLFVSGRSHTFASKKKTAELIWSAEKRPLMNQPGPGPSVSKQNYNQFYSRLRTVQAPWWGPVGSSVALCITPEQQYFVPSTFQTSSPMEFCTRTGLTRVRYLKHPTSTIVNPPNTVIPH